FIAAPADAKSSVRFPATVEAVDAVFKGVAGAANFDACVAFVRRAVGTDAAVNGPGNAAQYYRELVRCGVEQERAGIGSGSFTGPLAALWANDQNPLRRYRPMLSLRDVDEAGLIQGSRLTLKNRQLRSSDLAAAMTVLRNRGVSRGRRTAMSETDAEESD